MTDFLHDLFSHVCGQHGPFVCDGSPLPVCVRCLGLYLAAGVTAAWILISGLWRRGLPSWSVFALHAAVLLAAMAGGLHLWGDWQRAKLLGGLWTGHAAIVWLIGAGGQLWRACSVPVRASSKRLTASLQTTARGPRRQLPWRLVDKVSAFVAVIVLTAASWPIPLLVSHGWWTWSLLVVAGLAAIIATATFAVVGLAFRLIRTLP